MAVPPRTTLPQAAVMILLGLFAACTPAVHAESTLLSLMLPDRIRISERSNLSRTEDGRYTGLTNRQITGYLTRDSAILAADSVGTEVEEAPPHPGEPYSGQMFVFEQTLRDMSQIGRPVSDSFTQTLSVDPQLAFEDSTRVPRYRRIPTLPEHPVSAGDSWTADGEFVVALPHGAPPIVLPVEVSYSYRGTEVFDGKLVHRIEAGFGTRYPPRVDPDAEESELPPLRPDIARIAGRHSLTILLPGDTGAPFFIRDELEEQYDLTDNRSTLVRGHMLLFVYGLSVRAQRQVTQRVQEQFEQREMVNVDVEQTATGTRLTIQDIQFLPDQAVILDREQHRLDQIASVLQSIPDVRFLVVGHTADVGTNESQVELSWRRAQVIVAELVRRGSDQTRFDVDGRGGREPVAPNEDEAGRARNRRVEIYIVEE